jgi:hypothetical protein
VWASWELEGVCDWKEKSLKEWVSDDFHTSAIIVGKVLEIRSKINQQQDSSCWARFSISEWIKGSGDSEMWVNGRFLFNRPTLKDLESPNSCQFKAGNTYIVYGQHVKRLKPVQDKAYALPMNFIGTAWNIGMPHYFCLPNQRLYGVHPSALDKKNAEQHIRNIKNILNKGK